MTSRYNLLTALALCFMTLALSACGNTWQGLRQDTGQNVEATGEAMEDAGERIQPN
jgi:predicted small secreted protein